MIDRTQIQRGDVIRGRRYGRKTKGNYVVDAVHTSMNGDIAVTAHREYGAGRGKYMMIEIDGARIIRSYR